VFNVVARDVFGQSGSENFTLDVNAPPVITGLGNATVQQNTVIAPIPITFADDRTGVDALSISLAVSDASIITSATLTGTGPVRLLNITLAADRHGSATLAISANDGVLTATATGELLVTTAPVPLPPTGFTATPDGDAVIFAWTPPGTGPVPTFYVLEGGNASGAITLPVINIPAPNTSFRTVVPNGTWYFRARSGNAAGVSLPSNEVVGTIGRALDVPGAPVGLVATIAGDTVGLSWQPPQSGGPAAQWRIELGSSAGASDRGIFAVPSSIFGGSGRLDNGVYFARVRGTNIAGEGPASNEVRFTIGVTGCDLDRPDPPVLLPATIVNGIVTLTWRPPANAPVASYQIRVGSAPGLADLIVFTVGPVTSFTASAPSGQYHVSLIAINQCDQSLPSNNIVVIVP
jgi:hypothetical protein